MISILVDMLRVWIGFLTTAKANPGQAEKLLRACLLVPAFGFVLVVLHLRARIAGAWVVEHRAVFGAYLRCRLPDLIQMYIVFFDRWEPDLTRLISQRLRTGDGFIDVGANIGYYSLLAASRVGAQGHVVAIDALPSNFAELQHNLARNGLGNVRAVNYAVADAPGQVEVYAGPAHNLGLATTAPGTRSNLRHEATVPAAPLADCLEPEEIRQARLVKIDVEGAEPGVLAGLSGFLAQCNDEVEFLLELSPLWWDDPALTPETVLRPLREAGFHTYVMENDYWPWRYLWPNAVAAPRRVHKLADTPVKRIDLVLSRVDATFLSV